MVQRAQLIPVTDAVRDRPRRDRPVDGLRRRSAPKPCESLPDVPAPKSSSSPVRKTSRVGRTDGIEAVRLGGRGNSERAIRNLVWAVAMRRSACRSFTAEPAPTLSRVSASGRARSSAPRPTTASMVWYRQRILMASPASADRGRCCTSQCQRGRGPRSWRAAVVETIRVQESRCQRSAGSAGSTPSQTARGQLEDADGLLGGHAYLVRWYDAPSAGSGASTTGRATGARPASSASATRTWSG